MASSDDSEQAMPVALITGAGKGLGKAFATALGEAGWRLVLNNRTHAGTPSSAQALCNELQGRGIPALADGHDVEADDAAKAMVARAIESFGRLDAVVLNAGVVGDARKVAKGGGADLRDVIEINFFAAAALALEALPHLMRAPAGRLLFVASSAGLHGLGGRAAYAASKGAILGFARSLASELRDTSVRVNAIAPYAETQMTAGTPGAGDAFAPAGAAQVARFLCSPECQRNGEVWVAGADRMRRSASVEGPVGPASAGPGAFDAIASLDNPSEFPDATLAFADFARRCATSEI